MKENLHIFLHVATMGRYQEVLDATLAAISGSALQSIVSSIEVHVVGEGPVTVSIPQTLLVRDDKNVARYEFATLAALRDRALRDPDSRILYLNCLGGRYVGPGWDIRARWRELLNYVLIERFEACLDALDNHDVCGVDWSPEPLPHMTSNNWWARGDYIAKLSPPDSYQFEIVKADFSAYGARWEDCEVKKRHAGEFWIGSGPRPLPFSMFPLAQLGLPKGEFGTVSWWDLPGVDWARAARGASENNFRGLTDLRFSALRARFWIRSVLRRLKALVRGRSAKVDLGGV